MEIKRNSSQKSHKHWLYTIEYLQCIDSKSQEKLEIYKGGFFLINTNQGTAPMQQVMDLHKKRGLSSSNLSEILRT